MNADEVNIEKAWVFICVNPIHLRLQKALRLWNWDER